MIIFWSLFVFISSVMADAVHPGNDRPIIGVVTEEINSTSSIIFASYVKFLESGGARVIPIWIRKPVSYYEDIMSKINGILFPGGGVPLQGAGYGRTGRIIFEIATKMNDQGDYFPLWGTCLGFELLNYMVAQNKLWMKACSAKDLATKIEFAEDYKNSRLFKNLETNLDNTMTNQNVAIHYHQWCFTPQNYTLSGLDKYFKVVALNRDSRNMTFVSLVEAFKYPFYGISFHPEKVLFEWVVSKTHKNIPHSLDAVRTSQYFANFFVNEARKSNHHFPSKKAEDAVLIYNYDPIYIGKYDQAIEQYYLFTE